jgi:hypothetical protein
MKKLFGLSILAAAVWGSTAATTALAEEGRLWFASGQ